MGTIGSAETLVTNDHILTHNIPEERRLPCVISGFRRELNGVNALL